MATYRIQSVAPEGDVIYEAKVDAGLVRLNSDRRKAYELRDAKE